MSENKIDKLFKDSLSNHEMPYDAAAWSALDKKLSARGNGGQWKWFAGGAAIIAVAVGSVYFLGNDTNDISNAEKTELAKEEQMSELNAATGSTEQTSTYSENQSKEETTNNNLSAPSASVGSDKSSNLTNSNVPGLNTSSTTLDPVVKPNTIIPGLGDDVKRSVKLPTVSDFCENESISIHNINEIELILIYPNGSRSTMKSHANFSLKNADAGNYTIAAIENGKITESTQFTVKNAPKVDLYFDNDIKYTNGVPTTVFSTTCNGADYQWNFGKVNASSSDKTAVAHFFQKGLQTVSLTVTANNGCKTTETAKVNIEENYNLLAVDAFNPTSTIDANRTFMPEALKDRNTEFKLIIIDPNTGATIYETTDVSQPWDGVDRRNGQMALPGKTFLWKVILEKPLPGEASNYAGSVIVTSNR